jgi:SPP1 gp7 family putative phage head morphogenesis protein
VNQRTKVLRPIEHRDAYTEAVQPHVQEYFDEALFAPLFAILREERAPMGNMKAAEGPRSAYDNADGWESFPSEMKTLGVPRRMMPQITADQREGVVAHLAALGVASESLRVPASDLSPTQDEWSPAKVDAALDRKGSRRPILVSGDWRVVDGHHQWLGELFADGDVNVVRFLAPTRAVLDLMATFPGVVRDNARGETALERALDSGEVWYADGVFSGRFSVAVAKQLTEAGAAFDERTHVFRLGIDNLPADVRIAAAESLARSERAHDRVQAFLAEAQRNFGAAATGIDVELAVGRITADLAHQFNGTVKGLDWITVQPEVDPAMRRALTAELTENLNLDVKRFLAEEIPDLRRLVEQNVFDGMRGDKLAEIIGARYGVTKRKAAFLAFQETSLLVSNYREQQARAIGSLSYVWSTSRDERVRKDHKDLNGRTFFWGDPPITNKRTAAHNNPGEDFGCRCVAMPIITVPDSFEVINSGGDGESPTVSRCNRPRRCVIAIP